MAERGAKNQETLNLCCHLVSGFKHEPMTSASEQQLLRTI